ncbi:MAG: hypothetical protein HYS17_06025 [Micavibrio aeruginosavorus]|uniref:Uncharacterized protein n=1 Tax=Micavibrio aeruginosavorus TaxID=349221 RepID=A0A7T5R4J2_9BACT|nr:MAG: hypothetical protein HYS17_06025 [Micavibrio aeruginosavorus]
MPTGWNTARRLAASERIRTHKPWLKSTGPRTPAGKAITRLNALKHGRRSAEAIAEHRATLDYLRQQRRFLAQVRLLLRLRRQAAASENKATKTTNEVIDLHVVTTVTPCRSKWKNAGNPREFLLNMANCALFAHPGERRDPALLAQDGGHILDPRPGRRR